MGIWEATLLYLTRDDTGLPTFVPAGLFEPTPMSLPSEWQFSLQQGIDLSGKEAWLAWVAKWGYEELVRNPSHSDDLIERDRDALAMFDREFDRTQRSAEETPATLDDVMVD